MLAAEQNEGRGKGGSASETRQHAKQKPSEFDIENDPDMPEDAVNSNVIIEEIEMNGKKQKVYRKTY